MPVEKTTMPPAKKKIIPESSSVEEIRPIKNRSRRYSSSSEEVKKPVIKSSKKKVTSLSSEEVEKPVIKSTKKKVTSPSPEKAKKPATSPSDDSSSNKSSDDEFRTKVIVVKKEIPFDEKSHLKEHLPNILADLVTGYNGGLLGEVKTSKFRNVDQIISLDGDILYILKYYKTPDDSGYLDYRIFSKNLTSGEKKEIKLTPSPEEYVVTCSVSNGVFLLFGEYNSLLLYSMESGKLFCTVKNSTEERIDLIKLISITRKNATILLTLYYNDHDEINTVLMIDMENQKVKSLDVDGEYLGARNGIPYFVDGENVRTIQ